MPMNHGYTYPTPIDGKGSGLTALAFMAERFPHDTAQGWALRFQRGEITCDGRPVAADEVVRAGQMLLWKRPPWNEPDVPTGFQVIAADDAFAAVDKPSGLPTLPGAGFLEQTLLHQVRRRFPGAVPMHRLGRGTTGIVLFARTQAARQAIQGDWQARQVKKTYLAVVEGVPPQRQLIRTPIGPVPHPLLGTVNAASPTGKKSESEMRRLMVLEQPSGAPVSVVEVRIATGRPHQIRIHMASIGHPLAGDPLFRMGGRPDEGCTAVPGDLGYRLHAWKLGFRHPTTGEEVRLRAPLPEGWPVKERDLEGI